MEYYQSKLKFNNHYHSGSLLAGTVQREKREAGDESLSQYTADQGNLKIILLTEITRLC